MIPGLERRVLRAFEPLPVRMGYRVRAIGGRPVGVVVADSRPMLSGAACRCGAATYDRSLPLAAAWLGEHLAEVHGAVRLSVDTRHTGRGPEDARVARQIAHGLSVPGRRAAA